MNRCSGSLLQSQVGKTEAGGFKSILLYKAFSIPAHATEYGSLKTKLSKAKIQIKGKIKLNYN